MCKRKDQRWEQFSPSIQFSCVFGAVPNAHTHIQNVNEMEQFLFNINVLSQQHDGR